MTNEELYEIFKEVIMDNFFLPYRKIPYRKPYIIKNPQKIHITAIITEKEHKKALSDYKELLKLASTLEDLKIEGYRNIWLIKGEGVNLYDRKRRKIL